MVILDPHIYGCGPYLPLAVFTFNDHPDLPLANYGRGRLGVLKPGYARSYLVVAYRHLSGVPLTRAEADQVAGLWKDRLEFSHDDGSSEAISAWGEARKKVPGTSDISGIEVYRQAPGENVYNSYLNCPADAFRTAVSTLNDRIKKFGAEGREVKGWLTAQDQVFAACGGEAQIPPAPEADLPPLARADRNYQIAAANFYTGNFDEAAKGFQAIAADASSPWRTIAPYLEARATVRKATLALKQPGSDPALLTTAETQIKRILADASLSTTHAAARRLLSFVSFRLHPEERARELSRSLLAKNIERTIRGDLDDYTQLLNRYESEDYGKRAPITRDHDLIDWIFTFQSEDKLAAAHALEEWSKKQTMPWLVAALTKVAPGHPQARALIDAALKMRPTDAGFATANFRAIRLLISAARADEARTKLDEILALPEAQLPRATRNEFLSPRMSVARNLDEMLRFAQRAPAGIYFGESFGQLPATMEEIRQDPQLKAYADGKLAFDTDFEKIVGTRMPLEMITRSATNATLPAHLQREIAIVGWTRAILFERDEIAQALAQELVKLVPELRVPLTDYLKAPDAGARQIAAIFLLLKQPGMRPFLSSGLGRLTSIGKIDDYRDNWWCALDVEQMPAAPTFFSAAEKTAGDAERALLISRGTAPNYLAAQTVVWATRIPGDPRAPEALALAVRATRYGCTDKETLKYSKQAFQLLHKQYPQSEWAKKTPYFFGN
jgi:hypothetical protein